MQQYFTLLCLWAATSTALKASSIDSSFYDFKIVIKGFKTEKAYLGYYYGDETYIIDSARVDTSTGFMRFTRYRRIPEGVYFIVDTEGVSALDFIVNGWKDFTIKTQVENPIDNAEVVRSLENEQYFKYLKELKHIKISLEIAESNAALKKSITDDDLKTYYRQLRSLEFLQTAFITKNEDLLAAKLVQSQRPFDGSDFNDKNLSHSFLMKSERPKTAFLPFSSLHLFWESFDFRDIRLLYSKVYTLKLSEYTALTSQVTTDLKKKYCDILLAKSKVTLVYYQMTLKWLTNYYESKEELMMLEYLVKNYHHRTGSGTSAALLEHLDKKVGKRL